MPTSSSSSSPSPSPSSSPSPVPGFASVPVEPLGKAPPPAARRTAGTPRWVLAGISALVLIALVVADVWLDVLRSRQHALTGARSAALSAAEAKLPVVLSYSYRTLDHDLALAGSELTGSFRAEFAALLASVIAPAARTNRTTTISTVRAAGVVQAARDDVIVLVFVDQTTTTNSDKAPVIDGKRVQLTMTRTSKGWLISAIKLV